MPNPDKIQVEAKILETVCVAALWRAQMHDRKLATVARAVLEKAGKTATPTPEQMAKIELDKNIEAGRMTPADARKMTRYLNKIAVAHPADRPKDAPRKRIRFMMPRDKYEVLIARIRASGLSMTATLEKGLEEFARTGEF